jgi:uncharacterized membrane-anchored protein
VQVGRSTLGCMHHAMPGTSLLVHRVPQSAWTRLLRNKVPELTVAFWALTVVATVAGGAAVELLAGDLALQVPATTSVMVLLMAIALITQFSLRRHVPAAYWLSVTLVSAVGSLLSANGVDDLRAGRWTTTAVFATALTATLAAWYASEHTLSVHTVVTRRREAFYWLALLFAFALGSSLHPLTLGAEASVVLWCAVLAAITMAYRSGLDAVPAYWTAYVVTWPLGASLRDVLGGGPSTGLALAVLLSGVVGATLAGHRRAGAGRGSS